MRIVGIEKDSGERLHAAYEDGAYRVLDGDLFGGEWGPGHQVVYDDEARLIAPVDPPQLIAIGLNYRKHAAECGMALPDAPVVFLKASSAVGGPAEPIRLPAMAPDEVDYECELAIVIGRRAKNLSPDEALDAVLGYTCGNDVTARDCQMRQDRQWARAKSFDTFAPLGPWIETDLDPDAADIRTLLNGETMQESNTSDMIFPCAELVSYCSRCMTLLPGSVILTGTPSGIGYGREPQRFLRPDDIVTVEIDGIGRLENPVEADC